MELGDPQAKLYGAFPPDVPLQYVLDVVKSSGEKQVQAFVLGAASWTVPEAGRPQEDPSQAGRAGMTAREAVEEQRRLRDERRTNPNRSPYPTDARSAGTVRDLVRWLRRQNGLLPADDGQGLPDREFFRDPVGVILSRGAGGVPVAVAQPPRTVAAGVAEAAGEGAIAELTRRMANARVVEP
eukprot:g1666.t1